MQEYTRNDKTRNNNPRKDLTIQEITEKYNKITEKKRNEQKGKGN